MNVVLSNPIFVAAFNWLDHAGPIVQLGLAFLVVGAAATAFGALATAGYNRAVRAVDQKVLKMVPAE